MIPGPNVPAQVRPAAQAASAHVSVGKRCYRVGQKVSVLGSGFAASSPYDISVDGVDFGQSLTSATGTLATGFYPGGLAAGQPQIVDRLTATDGSATTTATFTVTRATGALFGAGTGTSPRHKVPFEVWDFAPRGREVTVYLHYVAPGGAARATVELGHSRGQCGALTSARRELFPFDPGRGTWTLQFDTAKRYKAKPTGKVARLQVAIS